MARTESIAIGGYYPTPSEVLPLIAGHIEIQTTEFRIVDPCAGDGFAVHELSKLLAARPHFYVCELESSRYKALKERMQPFLYTSVLHGDAFRVEVSEPAMGLLFLNPPYDLDPIHGRLEEKFLERFTNVLVDDGLLVFLVPYYALKASAKTLATEYKDLACFRFPDGHFETYQQVALFAKKTDKRLAPDPKIVAQVEAWATSVDGMPILGSSRKKFRAVDGHYVSRSNWTMREFDVAGLLKKARPWRQTGRFGTIPVPHILPDIPVEHLMFRSYPVATAPRPAHIAAGIASGLFNGRRVSPKTEGLPDLLVKGVFDREYVTIEEKTNKEGDVSEVQIQQPKLVTTVLDLRSKRYTTLKIGAKSGSADIEKMTIEDLLEHYGPSLMRVMSEQCPVIYDPKRDNDNLSLTPVDRKLYMAQDNAAKAVVKLLGGVKASRQSRRNRAAILLGEIGSGKTTVSLAVANTIGRSMLVMCPPHLLKSWTDEAAKVVPNAEVRILQSVTDVDDLAKMPKDRLIIAILSRETSKLGHGWESVTGACPKCGSELPLGDLAKRRETCSAQPMSLHDTYALAARDLALKIAPYAPTSSRVRAILRGRTFQRYLDKIVDKKRKWRGFDALWVSETLTRTLEGYSSGGEAIHKAFGRLLLANYDEKRIEALIRMLIKDQTYNEYTSLARDMIWLLPLGCEAQKELLGAKAFSTLYYYSNRNPEEEIQRVREHGHQGGLGLVQWVDGKLTLDELAPGSLALAKGLLANLTAAGQFKYGDPCGERLFQAIPEPRRYALSRYISNRHPQLFDLFVADECHEYATDGSAQERSAHRISALGIPTIYMTGSIMNGYAESLFTNMWSLSPEFRAEFARDDRQRFIDRYGYRKRLVTEKEKESTVVEFGAVTDRVERSERIIGDAPGVLPLFLFRHLLPIAVTLHKADLALELPQCRQIKHLIQPDTELFEGYTKLQQRLVERIKKDRFKENYAGKLFGALAELPSYLDRSTLDTGNQDDGTYEIRYPASLNSELVACGKSFPSDTITNKEAWMIETIRSELAEGRNVMIFSWHVKLLPRLARIIKEATGEEVPILYADKVPTGKRQDWIDKHVVSKNRRVMVANPVCIQTGLNNLVHFSTQIWMENPACNPTIFRQGIGRIDRIGQKLETRIYIPVYDGTLQVQLHELLLRKVAVAISTDGLDPESALIAAGAMDSGYLAGLSIGKQLWNMLNTDRSWQLNAA